MKKRMIITLLAAAMTAGLLAGCGSKKEEKQDLAVTPIETPAAEETTEEVETPEEEAGAGVIPVEREIKDGKMQSYLTGEWKDEAVANRRPIAVMIPNNSPAMPQYGISKASIVCSDSDAQVLYQLTACHYNQLKANKLQTQSMGGI